MAFVRELFDTRHKLLAWLMLAVVLVISASLFTPTSYVFADDEENEKYSFVRTSAAATIYYDEHAVEAVSEESTEGEEPASDESWHDRAAPFVNAGGMLGFPDADYGKGFLGAAISLISPGEAAYSYDSFAVNSDFTGLMSYAMYGHALTEMGLDSSPGGFDGVGDMFVRWIVGALLLLTYIIAAVAELFFIILLKFLKFFNPFQWVAGAWSSLIDYDWTANSTAFMDALGPLVSFLNTIFSWLYDMAEKFFIPIWGVIGVATLLFAHMDRNREDNSRTAWSTIRGLAFKIGFIFFLVPILGLLYTSTLNALDEVDYTAARSSVTAVLDSTLMDFESWVTQGNLGLPKTNDGSTVKISTSANGSVDWLITTPPRAAAYTINTALSENQFNYTKELSGSAGGHSGATITRSGVQGWLDEVQYGIDIVLRYFQNQNITEAAYETQVKAAMEKQTYYGHMNYKMADFYENLEETSSADTFKSGYDDKGMFSAEARDSDISSGTYHYGYCHDGNTAFTTTPNGKGVTFLSSPPSSDQTTPGLSTLSMYNYLSTNFQSESMTVYSPNNTTSFTRGLHKSVNLVGEGTLQRIINAISAITEFAALGIVGFCYGIAMVVGVVKNAVKMVVSLPFGMMGITKFMAQVVILFVMMIAEIVLTVILFQIMSSLIVAINRMFSLQFLNNLGNQLRNSLFNAGSVSSVYFFDGENYRNGSMNLVTSVSMGIPSMMQGILARTISDGTGSISIPSNVLGVITGVMSIVLNGAFGVTAMRIRSSTVGATLQGLSNSVERVLVNNMSNTAASGGGRMSGGSGKFNGTAATSPSGSSSSSANGSGAKGASGSAASSAGGEFVPTRGAAALGAGAAAVPALASAGTPNLGTGGSGLEDAVGYMNGEEPSANASDIAAQNGADELPDGTAQGGTFEDANSTDVGGARVAVAAGQGPTQGNMALKQDGKGEQYGAPGSSISQVVASQQQAGTDEAGAKTRDMQVSHENDDRGSAQDAVRNAVPMVGPDGQPIVAGGEAELASANDMALNAAQGDDAAAARADTAPIEGAMEKDGQQKATAVQEGHGQVEAMDGNVAGKVEDNGQTTASSPEVNSPDVNTKAETGIGNINAQNRGAHVDADKADIRGANAQDSEVQNGQTGPNGQKFAKANESARAGGKTPIGNTGRKELRPDNGQERPATRVNSAGQKLVRNKTAAATNVMNPNQAQAPAANRMASSVPARGGSAPMFKTNPVAPPAPTPSQPRGNSRQLNNPSYQSPAPTDGFGNPGTKQNAVGEEHEKVMGGSDDGNISWV